MPRRKTKVDLKYDKGKDLTTVRLPISLWEGLNHTDSVNFDVAFTYPGHKIVTPKTVRLLFYGSNDSGIEFAIDPRLIFVIDDVRVDLGKMKMVHHSVETRGEYSLRSFQVFDHSISYDDFVRIAKANKVEIELDDRKYNVLSKHLQSIRDFAELMTQSGEEFK